MQDMERTREIESLIDKVAGEYFSEEQQDLFNIYKSCLSLKPPQLIKKEEGDEDNIGFVTLFSAGRGGGYTKKSGNLIVNFKKLLKIGGVSSAGAGTTAYIVTPQLLGVLGALLGLCLRLYPLGKISLDSEHALVIYALSKHVDQQSKISDLDALTVAQQVFNYQDFPKLYRQRFDDIINNLERMRIVKKDNNVIELLEEVRLKC